MRWEVNSYCCVFCRIHSSRLGTSPLAAFSSHALLIARLHGRMFVGKKKKYKVMNASDKDQIPSFPRFLRG